MKYLDLTLSTPAENLACDEALLDSCESGSGDEILRFWEPRDYFVVVGYGNSVAREVNLDACRASGIPILRRCSGGGTVLQGPGCLNYTVILKISGSDQLQSITGTNQYVLERNRNALQSVLTGSIELKGQTDLAIRDLKFSGNAQRRKRNYLIFHGTLLLNFDLTLIEKFLPLPSQQPDYRHDRRHSDFLTNLTLSADRAKAALREAWSASEPLHVIPIDLVEELSETRYSSDEWNLRI